MTRNKLLIIVIIAVVLVLGGVVTWLFMSGKLGMSATPASTQVQKASLNRVCDNQVVDSYNKIMNYQGEENAVLDEGAVERLNEDIKGKSGYESDPTCQTILFWIAVHNNKYDEAKKAYDAVNNLHDQGFFADSNLGSAAPLFVFKDALSGLSQEGQEGQQGQ